jgi:hypothetical protein
MAEERRFYILFNDITLIMKYVRLVRTRYKSTRIYGKRKLDKDDNIRFKGKFYHINTSEPIENYDNKQYYYFDTEHLCQLSPSVYLDRIRTQSLIEDIERFELITLSHTLLIIVLLIFVLR